MILDEILRLAIKNNVSDVILKAGCVPRMRYAGRLFGVSGAQELEDDVVRRMVNHLLPKHLQQSFSDNGDVDFSYQFDKFRFRVNLFKERQRYGLALRLIKNYIPNMKELRLPKIANHFTTHRRGLTLVTGATGSGKSTTLANLIDQINEQRSYHIVTIEDPIEYMYAEKKSTVSQREIGIDTISFSHALRAALRQNPDVILVGELRDKETIETALKAAETGHLVFSTLHTNDSVDTLTRIMSYFDSSQHTTIRMMLARCLNGTISQRLIPAIDNSMICAFEVMVANAAVRECILKQETYNGITAAIQEGKEEYGMISFDRSLYQLCSRKLISKEVALNEATSRTNLELKLRGVA